MSKPTYKPGPWTSQLSTTILELRRLTIEALLTDGSHHKQWYLEQILTIVCRATGENTEDVLKDCERGTAP